MRQTRRRSARRCRPRSTIAAPATIYAALASLGDDLRFVLITSAATRRARRRARRSHGHAERAREMRALLALARRRRRRSARIRHLCGRCVANLFGAASRAVRMSAWRPPRMARARRTALVAVAAGQRRRDRCSTSHASTRSSHASARRRGAPLTADSSASCSRSTPARRSASSPTRTAGSAGSSPAIARRGLRRSCVWLLRRGGSRVLCAGLALILGGALGNLWTTAWRSATWSDFLPSCTTAAGPCPRSTSPTARSPSARRCSSSTASASARADRPARTSNLMDDVLLANPRGFCAGVDRAIAIVEQALAQFGAPIYVRHEVVHNKFVVDDLRAKGAVFVEELDEVPRGATVVFCAHGVSKAVRARSRRARPARVRRDVPAGHQGARRGREDARAGPRDRDDRPRRAIPRSRARWARATAASISSNRSPTSRACACAIPTQLAYVTQTTLSVDDAAAIVAALKARFPRIVGPKRTTSATRRRTARTR